MRQMLKIYGRRTSGNVMKPLWLADELGLKYEQIDVGGKFGGNDKPEYRAMNPMGLVPTIDDDGFVMWESNAITRYLAAKHAPGTLCPSDPQARATAETWMDWKLSAVNPMMTPIFWGLIRTKPEDRDMKAIAAAIERGKTLWGILDRRLEGRDYIMGDQLTIADIPIGPQAHRWFNIVEERPAMPNLEAWYERLKTRPPFQKNIMIPIE